MESNPEVNFTAPPNVSTAVAVAPPSSSPDNGMGEPLLDDLTFTILRMIVFIILSFIVGLFGTVANIINIIVFIRQGLFSGGSTLNLFFLSVADLGVVSTTFVHSIFVILMQLDLDLSWDPFAVVYIYVGWPHTTFMLINRMLTAYVAFERCMCVVVPFRVQNMFTPRRSLVYISIFFAYGFIGVIPIFMTRTLEYRTQEGTNSSKLVLVFHPDNRFWHDIVYYVNLFFVSFLSVVVVFVCTIITSTYVTRSKQWRTQVSSASVTASSSNSNRTENNNSQVIAQVQVTGAKERGTNAESSSNVSKASQKTTKASTDKEAKLVKMIMTISIIFLICYIPILTLIFMKVDDRIATRRQYQRLFHFTQGVNFVSTTVNSSINIFVYYTMSSNYKRVFQAMFGKSEKNA